MLQGLTLDIEKGNLLRLGRDGYILAACHGTRYTTCRGWVGTSACHGTRYTTCRGWVLGRGSSLPW